MYSNIIISGGCGRIGLGFIDKLSPLVDCIYALDVDTPLKEKLNNYNNVKFIDYPTFLEHFVIPENSLFIHAGFARKSIGNQLSESLELSGKLFGKLSHSDAHIINISSQAVYVANQQPWTEDSPRNPNDLYGLAKTATEVLLKNLCPNNLHTNIRLIALSGATYPEHILYKMVNFAIQNGTVTVKGNNKYFSFMEYKDAINAFYSFITSQDKNWQRQYNIGNSINYNIVDIAKEIQNRCKILLNKEVMINIEQDNIDFDYKMDASKFMHQFSWAPQYSLTDSIDEIIKNITQNQ